MAFRCVLILWVISHHPISPIRLGTINNVNLLGEPAFERHGVSCDECTCILITNITFVSFNCNVFSQSCAFFSAYNATVNYQLTVDSSSRFSFLHLPSILSTTTESSTDGNRVQSTEKGTTLFQSMIDTTTDSATVTTTSNPCPYTIAGRCDSSSGADSVSLNQPIDVFISRDDSVLYVGEYGNSRVQAFQMSSMVGTLLPTSVSGVVGIYYDDNYSALHVSEWDSNKHSRWPSGQTIPASGAPKSCSAAGGWYGGPYGVVGDQQGTIYVSHNGCNTIVKWTANATTPVLIGGTGTAGGTSQQLNSPRHMYLDELNSFIYVADTNNHRVQRFATNGSGSGVTVAGGNGAGNGANQLRSPTGVYVSRKDGSVYVSDQDNHRIQKWAVNAIGGVTVAGSASGTSGNTPFTLNKPFAMVLDRNETYMYIADYNNNRVQRHPVP